jgi:hypothetical protein
MPNLTSDLRSRIERSLHEGDFAAAQMMFNEAIAAGSENPESILKWMQSALRTAKISRAQLFRTFAKLPPRAYFPARNTAPSRSRLG